MTTSTFSVARDLGNVPAQTEISHPRLPNAEVAEMLRSNGAKPSEHLLESDRKIQLKEARERADEAANSFDTQSALKEYAKIIALDPSDAKAYADRAFLLRSQAYPGVPSEETERADIQHAIADYTKAIELDPKNSDYYTQRAYTKCYRGAVKNSDGPDLSGALADYSKAIELNPSDTGLYQCRANIKNQLGQNDEAIKDMNKAIEINPKSGASYLARGDLYVSGGKFKEAYADYHQALKVDPKNPDPWHHLSQAKAQTDDLRGCLEDGAKYLIAVGDQRAISKGIQSLLKGAQDYRRRGDDADADFAIKIVAELESHVRKHHHN